MDVEVACIKRYPSKPQALCNLGTEVKLAVNTIKRKKVSEQMSKAS